MAILKVKADTQNTTDLPRQRQTDSSCRVYKLTTC